MTTLPSGFWSGWVIVITLLGLVGILFLAVSVFTAKDLKPTDEVWDETLTEGSSPMPKWWFFMLFSFLIFSALYLFLYPGLGSFQGFLKWSQATQYEEGLSYYQKKTEPLRKQWLETPIAMLAKDKSAMASARRLFSNQCATCHGDAARGQAQMFPNLRDEEWQWGGSEKQILHSITKGRVAAMPGWENIIGKEGVLAVTRYVISLSDDSNRGRNQVGKKLYLDSCASCHGNRGKGNVALGAPNLTDHTWLYGGDEQSIYESISQGRNGLMPAQEKRLHPAQIRILGAWLMGGVEKVPPISEDLKL